MSWFRRIGISWQRSKGFLSRFSARRRFCENLERSKRPPRSRLPNSFELIAESSFSFQPCLAQGGTIAFSGRWIFEGRNLLEHFQRGIGIDPPNFCYLSPGFLQPA